MEEDKLTLEDIKEHKRLNDKILKAAQELKRKTRPKATAEKIVTVFCDEDNDIQIGFKDGTCRCLMYYCDYEDEYVKVEDLINV